MNIISNYKTIYYNLITNFYLILNLFLPLYDSVIISMHNQATKNLFSNIKTVKRIRMIEFLNELDSNDKLILDKNNNLLVVEYNYSDYVEYNSELESDNELKPANQNNDKGVLEELKKLLNNSMKTD
jgi:hypothetical protein